MVDIPGGQHFVTPIEAHPDMGITGVLHNIVGAALLAFAAGGCVWDDGQGGSS